MNNQNGPTNVPPQAPPPQYRPTPPVYYNNMNITPKKAMSAFDIMTILGFVSSIFGIFWCSIVLLPLAAILCAIGFAKGNVLKGLAIAGFVIATVGGISQLIYVLYKHDVIPSWVFDGLFN